MSPEMEMSYDEQVRERVALLRQLHPDGDYPATFADHPAGECVECDAIRALEAGDDG